MSSFLRKNGDSLEMNDVHSRMVGSGTREDTAVRQPPSHHQQTLLHWPLLTAGSRASGEMAAGQTFLLKV